MSSSKLLTSQFSDKMDISWDRQTKKFSTSQDNPREKTRFVINCRQWNWSGMVSKKIVAAKLFLKTSIQKEFVVQRKINIPRGNRKKSPWHDIMWIHAGYNLEMGFLTILTTVFDGQSEVQWMIQKDLHQNLLMQQKSRLYLIKPLCTFCAVIHLKSETTTYTSHWDHIIARNFN